MKATVFLLAIAALIATSYSEQPPIYDVFTDGKIGANDKFLATYSAIRFPNQSKSSGPVQWSWGRPTAHISYVEIVEVEYRYPNATAKITSGGVGSNSLTFEAVPDQDNAMHFEVQVWGTIE